MFLKKNLGELERKSQKYSIIVLLKKKIVSQQILQEFESILLREYAAYSAKKEYVACNFLGQNISPWILSLVLGTWSFIQRENLRSSIDQRQRVCTIPFLEALLLENPFGGVECCCGCLITMAGLCFWLCASLLHFDILLVQRLCVIGI
jgi:hypothetical protein